MTEKKRKSLENRQILLFPRRQSLARTSNDLFTLTSCVRSADVEFLEEFLMGANVKQ